MLTFLAGGGTEEPIFGSAGFFRVNGHDFTSGGIDFNTIGDFPVGQTNVSLSLQVGAGGGQNGAPPGLAAFGIAGFFSTLSFATDRPVFDLPEGWTVNSVSANIVNNYWIPPAAVVGAGARDAHIDPGHTLCTYHTPPL